MTAFHVEDPQAHNMDSYRSDYTSYDQDSFKPQTPSLSGQQSEQGDVADLARPPFTAFGVHSTGNRPMPFNLPDTLNMTSTDAQLEERRRQAIREKEREAAAKERNRHLLAKRREEKLRLKNQMEEEAKARDESVKEAERQRLQGIEDARLAKLKAKADEDRLREEERRRLVAVEHRRDKALQALEAQAMRASEHQRIQREAILQKRQHAERVKEETQRLYQERLAEEKQRKEDLIVAMNRYRENKIVALEMRKQSELLNKQEEELSQMVQVQATLSRLVARMHDIQVRREETRHKLLEARHLVEMLLIDENDLNLAHDEVAADLIKLKAHEEALARLVSTRYENDEYETAVVTIQRYFRGARDRVLCAELRESKDESEREKAAADIQKIFRGRRQREQDRLRKQQEAREMQEASIKMQKIFRGRKARKVGEEKRLERNLELLRLRMATRIQAWWRALQAKEMMGLLREMEALKLIKVQQKQPQQLQQPQKKQVKRADKSEMAAKKSGGARGRKNNKSQSPARAREEGGAEAGEMGWVAREQLRAEQRKMRLGESLAGKQKSEMGRIYLNPTKPNKMGRGPREKRMFIPVAATQRAAHVLDYHAQMANERYVGSMMNEGMQQENIGNVRMGSAGPDGYWDVGRSQDGTGGQLQPSSAASPYPPSAVHVMPSQGAVISREYRPPVDANLGPFKVVEWVQPAHAARPPPAPSGGAPNHAIHRGGPSSEGFPNLNREQASNYIPRSSMHLAMEER